MMWEQTGKVKATRLADWPIIAPGMFEDSSGSNINGPSLIKVPDWISNPLGRYYLYFAHHRGIYIRLAYADRIEGPWTIHRKGTLHLKDAPGCRDHIASPDVHIDDQARKIWMIFHGVGRDSSSQFSFIARSIDGLEFEASSTALAGSYLRAVRWNKGWLGMTRGGHLLRSDNIYGPYRRLDHYVFDRFPGENRRQNVRHVALQASDSILQIFHTLIGDAPERILRCSIDLTRPSDHWRVDHRQHVLSPERSWEGAEIEVRASKEGCARTAENALRDPALFMEDGRTYLLYAVAGEQGIGVARLVNSSD